MANAFATEAIMDPIVTASGFIHMPVGASGAQEPLRGLRRLGLRWHQRQRLRHQPGRHSHQSVIDRERRSRGAGAAPAGSRCRHVTNCARSCYGSVQRPVVRATALERQPTSLLLLGLLPLLWAGACARRQVDGDVRGEPLRPPRPGVGVDGGQPGRDGGTVAATDARASNQTDSGSSLPWDGAASTTPDTAPGGRDPTLFNPACDKCEARSCRRHPDFGDLVGNCFDDADPRNPQRVGRGPRPDLLVSEACKAVVKCIRETKCSKPAPPAVPGEPPLPADPVPCYCGSAVGTDCLSRDRPKGPCEDADKPGRRLLRPREGGHQAVRPGLGTVV